MTHHKKSNLGLGLVIGTVIGGVTAFLLSSKENRAMAKRKMAELKDMWEDEKTQEKVREIFGTVTEEGKKAYGIAKDEINKHLEKMGVDEVDMAKYKKMVDEAIDVVQKQTKESGSQLNRLRDYLMERWASGSAKVEKAKK